MNVNKKNENNAKKDYAKVTKFEILRANVLDSGKITCDIKINDVTIYGVFVNTSKDGKDFLSFPQRKGSNGKYYHIAYVSLSKEDEKTILDAIETALNE